MPQKTALATVLPRTIIRISEIRLGGLEYLPVSLVHFSHQADILNFLLVVLGEGVVLFT
jgi:hypothetical protein